MTHSNQRLINMEIDPRCFQARPLPGMYDETVYIKHVALQMQMCRVLSLVGFSGEVNWRFELTASLFPLLRKDKDQIKIRVSPASHAGYLKVMRYNWLSGCASVCGGQGDRPRERERGVCDRFMEHRWGYLSHSWVTLITSSILKK